MDAPDSTSHWQDTRIQYNSISTHHCCGNLPRMGSSSPKLDVPLRSFIVLGSEARLDGGCSVTLESGSSCPSYWVSGSSTIVLGRAPGEGCGAETRASWTLALDAPTVQHFRSGFLVLGCLRYFGGLHTSRYDARADIFVNDRQLDGFGLRIQPADHSDYFHRIPVPSLPEISPLSSCQTIYAWPLQADQLSPNGDQRVSVRIDHDVTWDIDYVAALAYAGRLAPRVFLSHNSEDKPVARLLASRLAARGVGVWLDEAEIKLGDSLIEKIRAAIDEVEYVAVLISRHAVASNWVAKELDIAMNQEIENRRVKVLPILLDNSQLPGFLKGKLYADLSHPDNLQKVIAAIEARLDE